MYSNNNLNLTPKLFKSAIWGVAGIVFFIVAMAFIRPWYNVWSQEILCVRQQGDLNNKTVIYVPTETNLPILESTRGLQIPKE